jgi:hypothetical protein
MTPTSQLTGASALVVARKKLRIGAFAFNAGPNTIWLIKHASFG